MSQEMSPEVERAVRQVEKLLRLAAKNPNEAEASAAAAKAQELLVRFNLDMSTIEQGGGSSVKREDAQHRGGLYHFQRDLWEAVAQLNFCLYWNQYVYDPEKVGRRRDIYTDRTVRRKGGYRFVHRVVGRVVNTTGTRIMAQYLEQTIERLTRERLNGEGSQFFTRWAISYREGIAARIIEKVEERRRVVLRDEQRKMHEIAKAGMAEASSGTAITIASVTKSEHDANIDFIYGDGTSAQWAADRAARAKAQKEAEEEYARWAKANPEEARKEEEAERKRARRQGYGRQSYRDHKEQDYGAYRAGHEAGAKVSIDPQMNTGSERRIGRG